MHTGKEGRMRAWIGSEGLLHDVLRGRFPTPYAFYGEVCHGGGDRESCK